MLFSNPFALFWRRQWVLYLCVLLTSGAAFFYYAVSGERYEAYTLLRAGQGIKERSGSTTNGPLGDGVDLQSRMESLSRIAKIDHVILEAASAVGYDRLSSNTNPTLMAKFWAWGKEIDFGDAFAKEPAGSRPRPDEQAAMEPEARAVIERNQSAILSLRDRVVAKQEGRSDLLRITFRHADPAIAASYLNELANALVTIQNTDVQMPGAQEFYQQQTKRLEEEAEIAAANLKTFSVEASIYSVDEQRALLLKRANDLATSISTTRGTIEERKGQKQAIVDQLQVLRPVSQSKVVSQMVRTLGGQEPHKGLESPAKELTSPDDNIPPLLLVKVYQDNMASLMKVNADLNGSTLLLDQLAMELETVNNDLASLSAKEAEYGRLKRALTTSSAAAAQYANRILEEEISSEVAKKSQLSSLRVVQRAITPTEPVFPQVPQLIGLALIGGILLGFALIVGPELARGAKSSQEKRALGVGDDDDLVDLLVARRRREGSKDLHSA
jgi:polysaccharide biosynthesis transport protein